MLLFDSMLPIPIAPYCARGLSTKNRRPFLDSDKIRIETHAYIAGTLEEPSVPPHQNRRSRRSCSHSFFLVEKYCLRRYDRPSQGSSSKRLGEKGVPGFARQNEYGAFSVSESDVEAVTAYITDQPEHHRKFSYQEELRELLKRHRVAFDERYLWE
jgi:putative transposase